MSGDGAAGIPESSARIIDGKATAALVRESVSVSALLPIRLKVGVFDVCCQTWA